MFIYFVNKPETAIRALVIAGRINLDLSELIQPY